MYALHTCVVISLAVARPERVTAMIVQLHPANFDKACHVSVSTVAETCARRGAEFSRFLQLVPGKGESQTTGKLCVLHLKSYPMRFKNEAKRGTVSGKAPRAAGINDFIVGSFPEYKLVPRFPEGS